MRLALFGPNNRFVALVHMLLGEILDARERYEDARTQYEAAIRVRTGLWGADNSSVAMSCSELGRTLAALGRYDGAECELSAARIVLEKGYGPDDEDGLVAQRRLEAIAAVRARHEPHVLLE